MSECNQLPPYIRADDPDQLPQLVAAMDYESLVRLALIYEPMQPSKHLLRVIMRATLGFGNPAKVLAEIERQRREKTTA